MPLSPVCLSDSLSARLWPPHRVTTINDQMVGGFLFCSVPLAFLPASANTYNTSIHGKRNNWSVDDDDQVWRSVMAYQ